MLLKYYLKVRLSYLLKHKNYHYSDCYKGGKMYSQYQGADKKSKCQVYRELSELCSYWKGYPDSYWRFNMFLKDFNNMEVMKTFIPQCAYGRYARNKEPKYQILIDDKILFHEIMSLYGLPVPKRFFSYSHGTFKAQGRAITADEVDDIIANITDSRIFVKRNKCGEARGVSAIVRKEDGFYNQRGQKLSAQMILDNHANHEYLFEQQIEQDDFVAQFNPDSVNTCRVLTYKNKVIACGLRMGRIGSIVDNASCGGIVVNIDIETGKFSDFGLREYDPTKYFEHPDTHITFKDKVLPQWPDIKMLVEKTSQMLPYYNSVGFDVACTKDGPIVVEINTGAGVYAAQMGRKVGIAEHFGIHP